MQISWHRQNRARPPHWLLLLAPALAELVPRAQAEVEEVAEGAGGVVEEEGDVDAGVGGNGDLPEAPEEGKERYYEECLTLNV